MSGGSSSSRRRFVEYKRAHRERQRLAREARGPGGAAGSGGGGAGGAILSDEEQRSRRKRQRPFWALLAAFWGMLRGYRWRVAASLGTLTIATLLGMLSPASTKVAVDYILMDAPGPEGIPDWL